MKLISNTGTNRVIDALRQSFQSGASLDIATPFLSLFAFSELRDLLNHAKHSRLILPLNPDGDLTLLGSAADRPARNRLHARWLARECANWIREKVELRQSSSLLPQSAYLIRQIETARSRIITGNCPLTTDGLGLAPGNQFSLIQCTETPEEVKLFAAWYESLWNAMPASEQAKEKMLAHLQEYSDHRAAAVIYYQVLFQLFKARGDELDEERIVKSVTGIKNTTVWKKLFKFQRDGVVGAIEKLERFGGCIIADSVGLGKTFEALAIIKYYELRNDRVLVLVPKRLRDNWTLYKANDRRNVLAPDRFNYDVLNHTD
ncbi:MAG TPA: SNF2-related protein, partial [Sedimentisphaerales bacterium]